MDSAPDRQAGDAASSDASDAIHVALVHNRTRLTLPFPQDATLLDLSAKVAADLSVPAANQKLLVPGRGLQKPPFKDPAMALSTLRGNITLIGSTAAEVASLNARIEAASAPRPSFMKPAGPARTLRSAARAHDDATYTFHTLRPLPYLPNPSRSLRMLELLRDDSGVRSAMRQLRLSVALLTEMDPVQHTTAGGKTLGLNRNRGEVIELRLRTDAYEGYRPYAWVRRTLCHELAHNVHGPHDRAFWDLCKQIERIVHRDDWSRGGRALAAHPLPAPPHDDDDECDLGGWTGGQFVLGTSARQETVVTGAEVPAGSLSRREILARAAEERMKKTRQAEGEGEG